jgi:hypothetical protein
METKDKYRRVLVSCPVDAVICDSTGKAVAKFENDSFYELNGSGIGGYVYENENGEPVKAAILPCDER